MDDYYLVQKKSLISEEKHGKFSFYVNNNAVYYADPTNGDNNYRQVRGSLNFMTNLLEFGEE